MSDPKFRNAYVGMPVFCTQNGLGKVKQEPRWGMSFCYMVVQFKHDLKVYYTGNGRRFNSQKISLV